MPKCIQSFCLRLKSHHVALALKGKSLVAATLDHRIGGPQCGHKSQRIHHELALWPFA